MKHTMDSVCTEENYSTINLPKKNTSKTPKILDIFETTGSDCG